MKIVYFIDSLRKSGGTERVTTTKLNWLASQSGVEAYVVTGREQEMPFFALDDRVRRVMIDVDEGDKKGYRCEIAELLGRIKPDVAVAVAGMSTEVLYEIEDGSAKVLEFHYTRNFLVNFVRGIRNLRLRRLHLVKMHWLQWKLARLSRRYDRFVGLTRRDVGLWGNPENMTYVHNPLSFRSARKSDCMARRIVCVGSWTPAKGQDRLLEAFGPLAAKYPDWQVELYGSGQDEALLRDIIARYGMEGQVTLHEPCSDIASRLCQASIYAFPSRSDGFGLVITEAMECGLPTVAMDCECGPCEIVTPDTGIVVPDNDVQAFSEALERLMSDPELRRTMGRNAQAEVRRFYPEVIMPQWLELFDKLIRR